MKGIPICLQSLTLTPGGLLGGSNVLAEDEALEPVEVRTDEHPSESPTSWKCTNA